MSDPDRPTLDERRSSRRIAMESAAREGPWPSIKCSILFAVFCLEYAGIAWCGVSYLPRIEAEYAERIGAVEMPEESAQVFRTASALQGRWGPALAPLGAFAAIWLAGLRMRRWALFDGLCFGGIILLALLFLLGYATLLVPLLAARP